MYTIIEITAVTVLNAVKLILRKLDQQNSFVAASYYGLGVYFALDASYSYHYTKPDVNGHRQMYYARVLTGEYTVGNLQMKTPPFKNDPSNPSPHYDTNVDNTNNPSIFVTYCDTQAYPEYIVTFQ